MEKHEAAFRLLNFPLTLGVIRKEKFRKSYTCSATNIIFMEWFYN